MRHRTRLGGLRTRTLCAALTGLAACLGCAGPPDPGEWGRFRYFDQVPGEPPLSLFPPMSDRAGNIYVLHGSLENTDIRAWAGKPGGTWLFLCSQVNFQTTETGAHGWVGFTQNEGFYWASSSLIRMSAPEIGCASILASDPATGSTLFFRAVIPNVRDTPSRTTAVAWVQSPTDRVPFQVLVDLRSYFYTVAEEFSPDNADDVDILGVGYDRENELGVVVVRYERDGAVDVQARFLDSEGKTYNKVSLDGLGEVPEYGIAGYLQASDEGLIAGLLSTGELLVFDQSGGRVRGISGLEPVGVHHWDGKLWVVGMRDGRPAVAQIADDGSIGDVQTWEASRTAASGIHNNLEVVDDRRLPARTVTWKNPHNAIGPAPFVSPHSLHKHADDTTLWIIAGPAFDFGGEPRTAVAVAPVGVTYP